MNDNENMGNAIMRTRKKRLLPTMATVDTREDNSLPSGKELFMLAPACIMASERSLQTTPVMILSQREAIP
jgi:hypothetical protein